MDWSIAFLGPVGAGKTQAIRSISDIDVVDTDVRATDETRRIKPNTTVSMDLGVVRLGGGGKLRLLGTPGQDRFDFMWDILLRQARGVVLLLNACAADPLADLEHYASRIAQRLAGREVPLVVAVTHADLLPAHALAPYARALAAQVPARFSVQPPVLRIDARDAEQVRRLLMVMTAMLEMAQRYPDPTRRHVRRASLQGIPLSPNHEH